jgi:hypothetical protein
MKHWSVYDLQLQSETFLVRWIMGETEGGKQLLSVGSVVLTAVVMKCFVLMEYNAVKSGEIRPTFRMNFYIFRIEE